MAMADIQVRVNPYAYRRQPPPSGAILIVDKGGAFRDHVAKVIGARRMPVEWTDSAGAAVRLCDETAVSLLMINTATPAVDPYRLCADVKCLPQRAPHGRGLPRLAGLSLRCAAGPRGRRAGPAGQAGGRPPPVFSDQEADVAALGDSTPPAASWPAPDTGAG